jgi:hypothetical protein
MMTKSEERLLLTDERIFEKSVLGKSISENRKSSVKLIRITPIGVMQITPAKIGRISGT